MLLALVILPLTRGGGGGVSDSKHSKICDDVFEGHKTASAS